MKIFFQFLVWFFASVVAFASSENELPVCKTLCAASEICMNSEPTAKCFPKPIRAPMKDLFLPFDSKTEVVCTHSSGVGSHSWPNAFYALDLATEYTDKAPTVLAAVDGKAFVFFGEDGKPCPEPKGTAASATPDKCGMGWGNRVKILHANGYASFYVHLEKVLIKNGEIVHRGQAIGIMGWTGLAGHRHLHFSVQKIQGSTPTEWEQHINWDGLSVPFDFKANQNGKKQLFHSEEIQCPHESIIHGDAKQPHFQGISP